MHRTKSFAENMGNVIYFIILISSGGHSEIWMGRINLFQEKLYIFLTTYYDVHYM